MAMTQGFESFSFDEIQLYRERTHPTFSSSIPSRSVIKGFPPQLVRLFPYHKRMCCLSWGTYRSSVGKQHEWKLFQLVLISFCNLLQNLFDNFLCCLLLSFWVCMELSLIIDFELHAQIIHHIISEIYALPVMIVWGNAHWHYFTDSLNKDRQALFW